MIAIFLGLAVGCAGGCLALLFLYKSITALLSGHTLWMGLFFLLQTAIIGVLLLATALLRPGQLVYTGIGLAAPMVLGSIARMLIVRKKEAREMKALGDEAAEGEK